ncbi:MAG: hypothetical protein ACE5GD_01920 [Candidatus Geothermarchaeales archaeon]
MKYRVFGCPSCRSLRATKRRNPICLYCGKPMVDLHAAFPTAVEAREYIEGLKEAEVEEPQPKP